MNIKYVVSGIYTLCFISKHLKVLIPIAFQRKWQSLPYPPTLCLSKDTFERSFSINSLISHSTHYLETLSPSLNRDLFAVNKCLFKGVFCYRYFFKVWSFICSISKGIFTVFTTLRFDGNFSNVFLTKRDGYKYLDTRDNIKDHLLK